MFSPASGPSSRLDPESQIQLLGHALKVRASLAVAIEGVDAAIGEVIGALDLPAPEGDPRGAAPPAVRVVPTGGAARARKRETPHSSR
jgi:hypothetical protein